MTLDLNKKNKTKKILLKKVIAAIVLSNLLQLSIHIFLRENPPPTKGLDPVAKGLILVRLAPKLFVPRHKEGKRPVSLVSQDQRVVIPRAYLHPVPQQTIGGDDSIHIEVPEKSLKLIMERKSQWEVYPFSADIKSKPRKVRGNPYEITF